MSNVIVDIVLSYFPLKMYAFHTYYINMREKTAHL